MYFIVIKYKYNICDYNQSFRLNKFPFSIFRRNTDSYLHYKENYNSNLLLSINLMVADFHINSPIFNIKIILFENHLKITFNNKNNIIMSKN